MKPLSAPFTIVLLCLALSACGSAATKSESSAPAAATTKSAVARATPAFDYRKVDGDKDNDFDTSTVPDNSEALNYREPADASDRRAITAAVKRYYAAAAAIDGTKACSMIYSTLAEAVPEDYGTGSGADQSYMAGTTCPEVLTSMFKHLHSQVMAENAALKVRLVSLEHHHGLVLLSFGKLPERQISVQREGRVWKIDQLFDGPLP